ncbi:transmembrane protein, putative (macronuclear) [Tetrahymena thermophila SB210]|uniref:Transmembrane protein, putative n=1 Tax=Tetrahymena thermophila (strain SB210) TaxID=312017 RepID=I7MFV1_TETTS|nr:transmembrane protein, putative [Tetrahymena thermophila SB210]EAR84326.1 transmembrane protein, putative [Tetrahymena thermophila SB210]|eukprot:XP_001031989.1 transmembrane protein, putative [Tetrahymena thermophila SB210]
MKLQQTLIIASVLSLLALATVLTLNKSDKLFLREINPDTPCLDLSVSGNSLIGENICNQPMRFVVAIYTPDGFIRDETSCLKKGEKLPIAVKGSTIRTSQLEC